MKTLTYIYAMLIEESPTKENFLLGDILLILMTNYFNVSEILTLDIRQLVWILTRAETKLKTATLHHWLKCSEHVEEIAKVVVECKALCTMYSFIKNQDSEEIVCKRAIDVLTETGDPECAKFIARMLTQTYKQPKIYNKLMLAGPSLFDHRDDALNMARFVSLVLVTVADEKAFRASCAYLDDLTSKWKDDPAIFGAVFSDVRVIRFLLIKMKYVSEDTTVVILDLLKTLLVVQKRHCIHVDVKLTINLDAALSGSEYKASKGMDILHLIMTNEDTFFQMDDKLVQSAVFTLFDLCKRQEIESKCLRCLSVVMKAHNWLAFKSSTHVFVETKCLLAIEGGSCAQFVAFLYVWLRVLRGGGAQQEGYVAHAGIVRNYLQRVDILIRLRESKKRKLFRLLKPLEMLRDRMFDQGHAV
ncbi:unnamed protein product [Callosobruchus maculatus]|nr:unnamed protein product [Callosobruchus maculatus]